MHVTVHLTQTEMSSVLSVWLSMSLSARIAVLCSEQIVSRSLSKCTAVMDVDVADCELMGDRD